MSKVYLVPASRRDPDDVLDGRVEALWNAAGLDACFAAKDHTAVKLHVGEPGTKTFVSPALAASVVRRIRATGARPFLTDTSVLYRSPRNNGPGHARVAWEHGFTLPRVGAPFIPADGLVGDDAHEVEVSGRHYERVSIASAILHARSVLILTHATGHLGTGFGGTLKNLAMGCGSRKAKLRMHHGQEPRIDPEVCRACGVCAEWCPTGSIEVGDTARIESRTCIGCGECIAVCVEDAVEFDWSAMGVELSERIVEHAAAVVREKAGHIAYVTALVNVTKNCDCLGQDEEPLLRDIGILASTDPVAIDRAALDLIAERAGKTLEALSYPDRDGAAQVAYAEELGLGTTDYGLVTVEA